MLGVLVCFPPLPPCLYFWWFCPVLSTSFLTAPFNHTIFNLRHLVRSGYFYKGRVLWPTAAYYSCSLDPYFHFHVAAHTSVTQVKLMINALIIALWILVPILFWELLCIHPFSAMIVEDWGGGWISNVLFCTTDHQKYDPSMFSRKPSNSKRHAKLRFTPEWKVDKDRTSIEMLQ